MHDLNVCICLQHKHMYPAETQSHCFQRQQLLSNAALLLYSINLLSGLIPSTSGVLLGDDVGDDGFM